MIDTAPQPGNSPHPIAAEYAKKITAQIPPTEQTILNDGYGTVSLRYDLPDGRTVWIEIGVDE